MSNLTANDLRAMDIGHLQSAWVFMLNQQTKAIQEKRWSDAERLTDTLNAIRRELGIRGYVEATIKID